MPGIDRTGPAGQGPMTGRRMGACAGDYSGNARYFNTGRGFGRGFRNGFSRNAGMGLGFGYRHGFRNQYNINLQEGTDKTILENEINALKNQLSILEERLSNAKGE